MFIIKIADLKIAIKNNFDYIFNQCAEYICSDKDYDFSVSVTNEEISDEQKIGGFDFNEGYLESICLYRNIAKELPKYNAFVMHGAAVKFEGKAYCFAAKSGTGKTTHINLWKQLLGEQMSVINGDKPIIRLINNEFVVFGTPWCGKENLGNNCYAPLSGICFLEQSANNSIAAYAQQQALSKLLPQIFLSSNSSDINATISLIERIIQNIPMWQLKCNISIDAAILSHKTMCGKN